MSQRHKNTDTESTNIEETKEQLEINIDWENNEKQWEIVSENDGGFDRIVRPDYDSAKSASEIHERATGNFAEINMIK